MDAPVFNPSSTPGPLVPVSKVILSVDDDHLILRTRQIVLEAAGYTVLSASHGEQALGVLHAVGADLVLLDCSEIRRLLSVLHS